MSYQTEANAPSWCGRKAPRDGCEATAVHSLHASRVRGSLGRRVTSKEQQSRPRYSPASFRTTRVARPRFHRAGFVKSRGGGSFGGVGGEFRRGSNGRDVSSNSIWWGSTKPGRAKGPRGLPSDAATCMRAFFLATSICRRRFAVTYHHLSQGTSRHTSADDTTTPN